MQLGNVGAVFFFEWRRSLTAPRIAWWLILTCFPACIVGLIRLVPGEELPREAWASFFLCAIPNVGQHAGDVSLGDARYFG